MTSFQEKLQENRTLLAQVWRLALPVLLTNLLQSLVGIVDVYMVGRLGPISIAAIGMSNTIRMLVLVMMLSVSGGAMSLIAQAKGARDPQRMSFVTRQSISSGTLLSLALIVIGLLVSRPLLVFANSGGDPVAVELGTAYLNILFLGMPFLILNIVFNRLMQGAGDTVTPLILTAAINMLNIGFNYMFMFGLGPVPAFGLQGAALGTVASRGIGIAVAFIIIYSGRNVVKILPGSYRPNWQMFLDIFSIGVPSGIQGLFRNGSRLMVISILTSTEVGTYGAAALAIGLQIESFAFMPVLGINVAGTSMVGNALGSWQVEEARRRGNMGMALGIAVMILLATPIIIFAPAIIRAFDPSEHPILASAGLTYLRFNTFFLPLSAISMVANGNLRGAGDSVPGMLSTLTSRVVVTLTVAYALVNFFGFGSMGVWIGLVMASVSESIIMMLRWRSSAWLGVALRKSELYRQHLHRLTEERQQQYLTEIRTPYMGIEDTIEQVDSDGVVYARGEDRIKIVFNENDYFVQSRAAVPA